MNNLKSLAKVDEVNLFTILSFCFEWVCIFYAETSVNLTGKDDCVNRYKVYKVNKLKAMKIIWGFNDSRVGVLKLKIVT